MDVGELQSCYMVEGREREREEEREERREKRGVVEQ